MDIVGKQFEVNTLYLLLLSEYDNVPGKLYDYLYNSSLFNDPDYTPPTTTKRKLPNKRVTDDTGTLYDPMYMP